MKHYKLKSVFSPFFLFLSAAIISVPPSGFAEAQSGEAPSQAGAQAALPTESITISQDEVRALEVPFEIVGYESSSKSVKILRSKGRRLEIKGVEPGY